MQALSACKSFVRALQPHLEAVELGNVTDVCQPMDLSATALQHATTVPRVGTLTSAEKLHWADLTRPFREALRD